MKYLTITILFFTSAIVLGQTTTPLSDILWDSVKPCHSRFEDINDDGIPDFNKVDDSKNGYLKVSGSWPTCGCSCSATVGAFKSETGGYTILQSDQYLCNWERKVTSNRQLKDVLPSDFGISSFMMGAGNEKLAYPIFFMNFEIPQIGTDTKVTIELVPFGLKLIRSQSWCYEYREEEGSANSKSLFRIKDIAAEIEDPVNLDYILSGSFNKISTSDKLLIQKAIGNDHSRFKSEDEMRQYLRELRMVYDTYMLLDSTELTLGWDRQASRFFIKEKGKKLKKISFRDFLIQNEYWSPMC